jgi:hypothetical protein
MAKKSKNVDALAFMGIKQTKRTSAAKPKPKAKGGKK